MEINVAGGSPAGGHGGRPVAARCLCAVRGPGLQVRLAQVHGGEAAGRQTVGDGARGSRPGRQVREILSELHAQSFTVWLHASADIQAQKLETGWTILQVIELHINYCRTDGGVRDSSSPGGGGVLASLDADSGDVRWRHVLEESERVLDISVSERTVATLSYLPFSSQAGRGGGSADEDEEDTAPHHRVSTEPTLFWPES